jgi:hypothetical protein
LCWVRHGWGCRPYSALPWDRGAVRARSAVPQRAGPSTTPSPSEPATRSALALAAVAGALQLRRKRGTAAVGVGALGPPVNELIDTTLGCYILALGQLLGGWANGIPSRPPTKSQQSSPKLAPRLASLARCSPLPPPTSLPHPPRGAGQRNSSRQQEQEEPKRKSPLGHDQLQVYI